MEKRRPGRGAASSGSGSAAESSRAACVRVSFVAAWWWECGSGCGRGSGFFPQVFVFLCALGPIE